MIIKFLFKHKILNQKGLSLMELLVGSAVGLAGMFLLSQTLVSSSKGNKQINVKLAMQNLSATIQSELMDPDFFKTVVVNKNYSENFIVFAYFGSGSSFSQTNVVTPFKIYDRSGFKLAGTKTNPVYLDEYLSPCSNFSNACPIKSEASITVLCPEEESSCKGEDINEVFVDYKITAFEGINLGESVSLISNSLNVPVYPTRSTASIERINQRTINTQNIHTIHTINTINVINRTVYTGGGGGGGDGDGDGDGGNCCGAANPDGHPGVPF